MNACWSAPLSDNPSSPSRQETALLRLDPDLLPYREIIRNRIRQQNTTLQAFCGNRTLPETAAGHLYFGLHPTETGWVCREWAPNAQSIHLLCAASGWKEDPRFSFQRLSAAGDWECHLPAPLLSHQELYRLRIRWSDGKGDRIPAYCRRVVQHPDSGRFDAQVWRPETAYAWQHTDFRPPGGPLLIYEAHPGMALEEGRIGTWREFARNILPRIREAGYNTLQLMAVPEHPLYASFGYQVSSFFAPSSRFGTPEELKYLIDTAHGTGLRVIMDLVHSHAVKNTVEGLGRFDGTPHQYFHAGERGRHPAWGSRCFDYGKPEVLHFLLSNCRYWLEEFHVDGFRFDGITSMLYRDHGLGCHFMGYAPYFSQNVDEDALTYLFLANRMIHEIRPEAVTIAEDISGMPGLALDAHRGGIGFDARFAMGIPDFWTRLVRRTPDPFWSMGGIWHAITDRRTEERTISYVESHDQALVGDKTLAFRLMDRAMYDHMSQSDPDLIVDRGMALHKMIRAVTFFTADTGYLNFMGNEFGHPEWIDFPRPENQDSFHYCRRQWSLVDSDHLKYRFLAAFDQALTRMATTTDLFSDRSPVSLLTDEAHKVIAFSRNRFVVVANFHPDSAFTDFSIPAPAGRYEKRLDSDAPVFGGHGRRSPDQVHFTLHERTKAGPSDRLSLYLPPRTLLVLERSILSQEHV